MSRQYEILALLRSVNPAPADEMTGTTPEVPTAAGRFPPALSARDEVRRRARPWKVILASLFVLVPLTLATLVWIDRANVSTAELIGSYRGTLLRDGGPGEANVRQLIDLVIVDEDGDIRAELLQAPAGATRLDPERLTIMPVEISISGRELHLQWDLSVGSYEDTTLEQCDWQDVTLTMRVQRGEKVMTLEEGHVEARATVDSEVSEFLRGCPNGRRDAIDLVLRRRSVGSG